LAPETLKKLLMLEDDRSSKDVRAASWLRDWSPTFQRQLGSRVQPVVPRKEDDELAVIHWTSL
jgi:hypothetical protein